MTAPWTRTLAVCTHRRSTARSDRHDRRTRLGFELLEDRTLLSSGLPSGAALPFTPTEVVAAVTSVDPLTALDTAVHSGAARFLGGQIDLPASRVLPSLPGESIVVVTLKNNASPLDVVAGLEDLSIVSWAAPNYVYDAGTFGDPRELTPNDPSYPTQYHHTLMKSNQAWDYTLGRASIIIGVTDDGQDLAHVDLYDNVWLNQGEIPTAYKSKLTDVDADGLITLRDLNNAINKGAWKSNDVNGNGRIDAHDLIAGANGSGTAGWSDGINNDANGYTDDIVGWDFSSNDLNPGLSSGTGHHGTHVAGIAAGHTNNSTGVAGTAGNATIMPLRFYGSGSWTSTVIYNSYAYAANNGARILNTSYNVDQFVGDPTFTAALNYIYGKGVLHFNSAGNANVANPPRTQYDQTLYVVSTNNQDKKANTSNYGSLTDIAAPGDSIYSTYPTNSYEYMGGTSMASPNAAGVAALIWSLHPTWTRDQVAAQLLGTADNINAQNPSYQNLLGAGRVNSFRAVSETIKPPKFDAVVGLPNENGTHFGRLTSFEMDLGSVFSASSMMNSANWQLRWAGFDGVLNNTDDKLIPLTLATTYMVGTNRFKFSVSARTAPGLYQFKAISGGLVNPFGTALDGNGNGVAGDHFTRNFYVSLGSIPGPPGGDSALRTGLNLGAKPMAVALVAPSSRRTESPTRPVVDGPEASVAAASKTAAATPHLRPADSAVWIEDVLQIDIDYRG